MGSTVAPTLPSAARLSEFTAFFDALSYISSEDTEPEAATSSRFSPPPQTPLSPDSPMFKSDTFFPRARCDSLHQGSTRAGPSTQHRSLSPPPPLPSGPSTPHSAAPTDYFGSSLYSSTSSSAASSLHPMSATTDSSIAAPIKSVSVPHHSRQGKLCLFACRVVPDLGAAANVPRGHARRGSLGKMRMAGQDEPHTVWRTWQEFIEFGASLTAAFPDDRLNPASPTTLAPAVPRLSKKVSLFVTRSTHAQRQNELDAFCQRLFDLPDDVKQSSLIREFFRFRPDDRPGLPTSATDNAASSRSALNATANIESAFDAPPVPAWLAAGDPANDLAFNDEIIKAVNPRTLRPKLAIKISSPNLRGNVRGFGRDDESSFLSPISGVTGKSGAGLLRHFEQPDALSRADSSFSMATMSSARTITPSPVAPVPTVAGGSMAKTIRKKASGGLRHIRSLGDLRSSSKRATATDEPVPALPIFPPLPPHASAPSPPMPTSMERAATQPLPGSRFQAPISSSSSRRPSAGLPSPSARGPYVTQTAPARENMRNARGSKSSISSFEDLWGTAFPSTFRQTPSGRVECVRTDEFGRPVNGTKRLSGVGAPTRTNSFGQASTVRPPMYRHGRQTSTTSISSVESARSGGSSPSMSMTMSRSRSSGGSEMCPTPPTPTMEWSASKGSNEGGQSKDKVIAGKYYVENGVLLENNMVPPPPFFPVPPPMQYAYSQDGLPHTPRSSASSTHRTALQNHARKSSGEPIPPTPRSRTGSMTSCRRVPILSQSSLDPILSSPAGSSNASSPCTVGGMSGGCWTFKLLHPQENVLLRVSRSALVGEKLDLEQLRQDVVAKFKASGVALPGGHDEAAGEWGLAWTPRLSSGAGTMGTKLVISQDDLDACLQEHQDAVAAGGLAGKIVLKVIC
ncbi:phox-like domain-containing protein [Rhodotorula toruloides]|uniref:Phox-like domain-containing protein n=1 Tax=Rhodotorula toruloides TaxID=5286 RepID=A0A511K995_RHOTO|nr:phox-like domain-containing protein [Rhodotorula toruloides]